jgi:mannose-6-phosphate isomerase-like protein (cupin superfamily)
MPQWRMTETESFRLAEIPVHLGLGASVVRQPPFTGQAEWYATYARQTAGDGREGRLVTLHTFSESWDSWEVHPRGEELVLCVEGTMTLHQEVDGIVRTVTIESGEAIINPPGVWHTADVTGTVTALFITAGAGTENRPR